MSSHQIAIVGLYLLAGTFAGLMSGIMGIGGGLVVVPALLFIYSHNPLFPPEFLMPMAAGTSLTVMAFTSQASIRAHHRLGSIQWALYNKLWPGIALGTVCGALLAGWLPTDWIEIFLGLFLLFVAFRMWRDLNKPQVEDHRFPSPWVNALISFFIGTQSGLLGIGGGAMVIPYLGYCGVMMRTIAPISALCSMTVAVIGTVVFILSGLGESTLPAYSTGFVYWPAVVCLFIPSMLFAPLGARLTYTLPVRQLRYGFIVFLIFVALHLLY